MAKKQKVIPGTPQPASIKQSPAQAPTAPQEHWLLQFRNQAWILGILGFLFYFNTTFNEFALDDRALIVQNDYVKEGLSGIPKLLTTDAFKSYLDKQNSGSQLEGGRYRPLSLITFAIEQQILGLPAVEDVDYNKGVKGIYMSEEAEKKLSFDMHVRHFISTLLYALCGILLLYTLRYILLPGHKAVAFVATLLFVINPIHTEVVANVKSRDEILSVIFICLTLISAHKYYATKQTKQLILGLVYFFLGLLSKEFAATLLILIPLLFYIHHKESIGKCVTLLLPYLLPFAIYIGLRSIATTTGPVKTEPDIMNNPYLWATGVQKFASEVVVMLRYLGLLFFPHPLSSDYGYKQLPYSELTDPLFWISLVVNGGLIALMFRYLAKRHLLAIPFVIYFTNLLLVSNIFFNLGGTMGERLMFHSSIGFCMAVAWYGNMAVEKWIAAPAMRFNVVAGCLVAIIGLSGFKTITRNAEWSSDKVLFLADVKTVPNSIIANNNAASACIEMGDNEKDTAKQRTWYVKGIAYSNKAILLYKDYVNGYLNRGVCEYKIGKADEAVADWDFVRSKYPNHPSLDYFFNIVGNYYFKMGTEAGKANNNEQALIYFKKGLHVAPRAADMWFNYGYASMLTGRLQEAIPAFEKCLALEPNNKQAMRNIELCRAKLSGQ
ncbi:MAG: tetratricopeptide repeat protein [Chitinophagia bacterium]|nr:tetratricopeptide repeat protein [Chitinophagia bacterium]